MAVFVLIHGGWGGGWEWTPVASKLRDLGHEVFTPTLTGLGEREHIRPSEVTLSDHIEDVVAVITFEGLDDVVLCGQSYGGMVVTGVADRIPERIRLLVYLDAFVPRDGESLADHEPEFARLLLQMVEERGDNRMPIPPDLLPGEGSLPEEQRLSYIERLRPQSANTLTDPVRLSGGVERVLRAYVMCTGYDDPLTTRYAERARAEGWLYRELATDHDLHLHDPDGTVALLDELAEAVE